MMLVLMYVLCMITGVQASLLGVLWPIMYLEFDVALSAVGVFSWISSALGILANLSANRILLRFGGRRTTVVCAFITALSLFGYTISGEFWMLCLLAVPCSLAGGIIGISMNNYIALHYSSRHMSWVHCMWGIGSIIGPNIVSFSLVQGHTWRFGYGFVFALWLVWTFLFFFVRKLWKDYSGAQLLVGGRAASLKTLLGIRGAKEAVMTFFCYNALEQGVMLWASSYMILHIGLSEKLAANYVSLFFAGITLGRMISGFLTMKFEADWLIRLGLIQITAGILLLLLPLSTIVSLFGLMLMGLGCAPICPCLLHSTPAHFGEEHSQALVGLQVAASTLGNCILPSLFGLVASQISIALFPGYLAICLALMGISHHRLIKLTVPQSRVDFPAKQG